MPLFYAKSLGGILEFSNKREVFDFLLSNNDWKGEYLVTIEKARGKRSLNQNAYLFGVVYKTVAEHTGNTVDELHEVFKRMFLHPKFIMYNGKEVKLPSSTTDLNKAEFGVYVDRIIAEAGTMGISIPEPIQLGEMPDYPIEEVSPKF